MLRKLYVLLATRLSIRRINEDAVTGLTPTPPSGLPRPAGKSFVNAPLASISPSALTATRSPSAAALKLWYVTGSMRQRIEGRDPSRFPLKLAI